jgi:hypothetical protein
MCGAGQAGVVQAKGHFNHIKQAFINHRPFFDQGLGCLLDGHADGGVVIGGAYHQVDFRGHTAFIRPIVMCERTTRCFYDAHAFGRCFGRDGVIIIAGDFRIGSQFDQAFGGVKQLNQPGPVSCQSLCTGLPPRVL